MRRMLALLTVPLLVGCGADDPKPSPTQAVRAKLTELADGVQQRRYETLCTEVLAPNLVSGLEEVGLTCPKALASAFGSVKDPQLSVDEVEVDGTKASAQVRTSALGQDASSDTVQLVQVKGGWRVSSLGDGSPSATPAP